MTAPADRLPAPPGAAGAENFWERWRRDLHEQNPEEVKAEYTNRLGLWHKDFIRDKPGQRETGNMFDPAAIQYPSTDFVVPQAGAWGGFNKSDLRRRGWTRTAIKRVLGEPDRKLIRREFRKDRPECIYDKDRVLAAEAAGIIRFRQPGGHLKHLPYDPTIPVWMQIDECKEGWRKPRKKNRKH